MVSTRNKVIGLSGLALIAAISQVPAVRSVIDNTASSFHKFTHGAKNYVDYGYAALARYRREQQTLEGSASPLELSKGNDFVAEYIRRKVDIPSVKDSINLGTTIAILVPDENGTPGYEFMAEDHFKK